MSLALSPTDAELNPGPALALPDAPPFPQVAAAGAGFAVLGLCAGLGAIELGAALRAVPASLAIAVAPFLLTVPALLVLHQLVGLSARPEHLIAAVANTLTRAGRLALGLSPTALFFAATSNLAVPLFIAAVMAVGGFAVFCTGTGFNRAERVANPSPRQLAAMQLIVFGWGSLTVLIGLRIAVEATRWAFFPTL